MAKKSTAANANATGGANPDAGAGTGTGKPASARKPANPENTIYWNGARDTALVNLILDAPGQLTTKRIAAALAQHPSFAGETHLLATEEAPEKIRQRVKKLNEASVKRGYGPLELQRLNNSGYDLNETLDAVFAGRATTPVTTSPAPAAGLGGLIPVPNAGA